MVNYAYSVQLGGSLQDSPQQLAVQSNLRTKDTLGTGLLSFVQRLSLSGRFNCINPQIVF